MVRSIALLVTLVLAVLTCAPGLAQQPPPPDTIPAVVDPRVEVLSIIFRLIEAGEYSQPSATSPYSKAVDAHFAKFANHQTPLLAAKLREERSIGFDAVSSFAAHLKDIDSCEFSVPLDPWPATFDSRWNAESALQFAASLKLFVRDSNFETFWAEQKAFRESSEARMRENLAKRPIKQWIESFFGASIPPDSRVRIGLLNGGANYGSSVLHPDGHLVVFPTIGVWDWDKDGLPVFSDKIRATVIHEFCHPFVNPLVDRHIDKLLPAGQWLHDHQKQVLAAQAYDSPTTILYESLVRASVVQILSVNESPQAAAAERKAETSHGFWWTPALADSLAKFSKQRDRFPTLSTYMDTLAADLATATQSADAILSNIPQIVSILPTDKSESLAPEVQFRIEFDRPMDPTSRGLSFEKDGTFESVTPSKFDQAGRIYTVTLRFKPGASVRAWINRFGTGLSSDNGYAVQPRSFEFSIKGSTETPPTR